MAHLARSTLIHAPVDEVYSYAHDSAHWNEWYVGFSDALDLSRETTGRAGKYKRLSVGMAFPLTGHVFDDHLDQKGGHWRARTEGQSRCVDLYDDCGLLQLTGESDWTFSPAGGDTRVTIDVEYAAPMGKDTRLYEPSLIERLEGECLERTLQNLRQRLESSH